MKLTTDLPEKKTMEYKTYEQLEAELAKKQAEIKITKSTAELILELWG